MFASEIRSLYPLIISTCKESSSHKLIILEPLNRVVNIYGAGVVVFGYVGTALIRTNELVDSNGEDSGDGRYIGAGRVDVAGYSLVELAGFTFNKTKVRHLVQKFTLIICVQIIYAISCIVRSGG